MIHEMEEGKETSKSRRTRRMEEGKGKAGREGGGRN